MREQTWDLLQAALDSIDYTRDPPPGPRFRLVRDDEANYAVLYVMTYNVDSYGKDGEMRHTRHERVVPCATYHQEQWVRWVFDFIAAIEHHETCESFQVATGTYDVDDECKTCPHAAHRHDGRDSSCADCPGSPHRYAPLKPRRIRPYAPHHGNGEDPYAFWPGGTREQKRKSPGDD